MQACIPEDAPGICVFTPCGYRALPGLIALLLLACTQLSAQEVSFSGWGAAGAMFEDKVPLIEYNQDYYYRAKLPQLGRSLGIHPAK